MGQIIKPQIKATLNGSNLHRHRYRWTWEDHLNN